MTTSPTKIVFDSIIGGQEESIADFRAARRSRTRPLETEDSLLADHLAQDFHGLLNFFNQKSQATGDGWR